MGEEIHREDEVNTASEANVVSEAPEAFEAGVAGVAGKAVIEVAKKPFWKEIREWIIALAAAVLIALLIRTFLFTLIRVDGESMVPTLLNNERLFVTVLDVKLGGVERGDVVICHYPNRVSRGLLGMTTETNFVKRVWGVPGDVVKRVNRVTYVNDVPVDGKKGAMYPNGAPDDYGPYTLGDDEYFVIGDNIYSSHDSRDWNDAYPEGDVGPITGDMIIGRARYVIWPLDHLRTIE